MLVNNYFLDKMHLLDKLNLLPEELVLNELDPCGVCRVSMDSTWPIPSSSTNFVDGVF